MKSDRPEHLQKLDAAVAVRLFGFEWWASRDRTEGRDRLCVLHAGDELVAKGWTRTNWAPEFYERLPAGTVWPCDGFAPFTDWDRAAVYEPDPRPHTWKFGVPRYSSDWQAAGEVVEWLAGRGAFSLWSDEPHEVPRLMNASFLKRGMSVCHVGATYAEALCKLALLVRDLHEADEIARAAAKPPG